MSSKILNGGVEGWNFGWGLLTTYGNDSLSLSHRWLILSHYDSFSYLGEGVTWKISNYAIAIIGNFEDLTLAVTRRKCQKPPNFRKNHKIGGNPPNWQKNRQIFGKTAKFSGIPPNFRENYRLKMDREGVNWRISNFAILKPDFWSYA